MLLITYKEVKLRVLLNLHTKLVESLDRGIAREEVLRPWSECDYLQVPDTDHSTGNRQKLTDLERGLFCGHARIIGNIGADVPHSQVV